MDTATFTSKLKSHPFLEGLTPEQVDKLASLAFEVNFDRDRIIFRVGDESSMFLLLLTGKVALEVPAPGRTFRIQVLGEGDELGWSSMVSPVRKQLQARSVDRVGAIAFDGARLLGACDEDPAFGYLIMRRILHIVAERLQATRMQLMDVFKPVGAKMI